LEGIFLLIKTLHFIFQALFQHDVPLRQWPTTPMACGLSTTRMEFGENIA